MKDNRGNKMKDYILRQRLAEYDAKLDLVYRNFSEYVHLAEKAFYSSVTTSSSEQYEIEKTEAALKQAKLEKEQAEHRIQRSLNYLDTQKKKKRKARTHLLIQKGAAIEAICKDTKYLTEAEFYQLMDELLHDPACKFCDVVHEMVRGRAEAAEAKEREFAEEEALLKAMQRGELPQGDE